MLAFSINHYGLGFRAMQSVEFFCAYDLKASPDYVREIIGIYKLHWNC